MTPERWARIAEVFDSAAELHGEERRGYLELACAGDTELRAEVDAMLAHDTPANGLSEAVDRAMDTMDPFTSMVAQSSFGPWKVAEKLGAGGMGIVYRAVRADGAFEKDAALKILHMDSPETQARFRHERHILARLEHPNIARLLDGGETAHGSYLVMEFVEGKTLLDYAAKAKLDRNARLRLFLDVCGAVSYLHRNLVVHRDLKPSNILVTAAGVPKLLDFGIAKLLHEDAKRTATGMFALTPQYASPEQVRGLPVTTGSDVYSLGVILFELLSGRPPYAFKTLTPIEVDRTVCEAPIPRPEISEDLDNILMMALRKEPERRYASVDEFADDIRRSLENLPVRARPDTAIYRTSKFLRRNWAFAAGLVVVLGSLTAGIVTTRVEANRAQRRFNEARLYANALLGEFYTQIQQLPGATRARGILMRETVAYLNKLAKESEGDPELQFDLAVGFRKIGDLQGASDTSNLADSGAALENYRRSLQLADSALAAGIDRKRALETISSVKIDLADAVRSRGDDEGALRLLTEAREQGLEAGAPRHATSAFLRIADIWSSRGEPAKAAGFVRDALRIAAERRLPEGLTANMYSRLAEFAAAQGRLDEALAHIQESERAGLAYWKQRPNSNYRTIVYRDALAVHAALLAGRPPSLGLPSEAISLAREAAAISRRQLAGDTADVNARMDLPEMARLIAPVFAATDRAQLTPLEEDLRAAEAVIEKAASGDLRNREALHLCRGTRAYCLSALGRCAEAQPLFAAAAEGMRETVKQVPSRIDPPLRLSWILLDWAGCRGAPADALRREARGILEPLAARLPHHAGVAAAARKASSATLPPHTKTPTRSSGPGT